MYSKYERRTDTRTYEDRRKLYEGVSICYTCFGINIPTIKFSITVKHYFYSALIPKNTLHHMVGWQNLILPPFVLQESKWLDQHFILMSSCRQSKSYVAFSGVEITSDIADVMLVIHNITI